MLLCALPSDDLGHAQQCCFGADRTLLPPGHNGAGTAALVDSQRNWPAHFWRDVLPNYLCCALNSDNCEKYSDKRPNNAGTVEPAGIGEIHGQ